MKKRRKKKKNSKIIYLAFFSLLFLVGILVFFNFNIYRQRQVTKVHIDRVKEELEKLMTEKELLEEMEAKDIDKEIERVAREQLLLRKEGESVIVISREEDENSYTEDKEKELKEKNFFDKLKSIFLPE